MAKKLRFIEQKEIERLERMKDLYIDEMMGKCELINEMIKEVRSGSWYERINSYVNAIHYEDNKK